ncbi:MAG: hypothetical protein JW774_10235 [Candidatus Aureabacteria bacterium]|nr:hypothetical protein [Candidatus Auribacterota bacterium]
MNVLFSHAATRGLGRPRKDGDLFQKYGEHSFFEQALFSYVYAQGFDLIVLIVPENESSFFHDRLQDFYSKFSGQEKKKMNPVRIEGIPDSLPYSLVSSHSVFHPLFMETQDLFGLWSVQGWEEFSEKTNAKRMLIQNMESFWYLNKEHYHTLLQAVSGFDFIFRGENSEDLLLGMNYDRSRLQMSRLRNAVKRKYLRMKENYQFWTRRSSAFDASKFISDERNIRLDSMMENEANRTLNLISPSGSFCSQLEKISFQIQEEVIPLSLRNRSVQSVINVSSFSVSHHHFEGFKQAVHSEIFEKPRIIRVKLNEKEKAFNNQTFKSAVSMWNETSFWVLSGEKDGFQGKTLENLLKIIRQSSSGRIYVESPSLDLTPQKLEEYYAAGTDIWVYCLNEFCLDSSLKNMTEHLDDRIASFLTVRDRFPDRFFMLKIQNNFSREIDFIPQLLQKWQYRVDGIVVTGDDAAGTSFHSKKFDSECTKVPFEMVMFPDGKFSLCSRINEGILVSKEDWREAAGKAGSMEICRECQDKKRYGFSQWARPRMLMDDFSLFSFFKETKFFQIRLLLEENDLSGCLNILEEILKHEPSNPRVWEIIDRIKQQEQNGTDEFKMEPD